MTEELWNQVEQRIDTIGTETAGSESDRGWLHAIADQAKDWGLDHNLFLASTKSNLRACVHEMRIAINEMDKNRLEQILQWAATETNIDLRLKLETPSLEEIPFQVEEDVVTLRVTKEQFDAIRRRTKIMFTFKDTAIPQLTFHGNRHYRNSSW
jgi:hypothetical protein